jgi:hypothetical protein
MRFKEFLINEQQAYLGQKVGNILTAVQELQADAPNMGSRELVQYTQQIINQIRPILHSSWPREEKKFLITLQKVGISLSKAVEEKGDLPSKISGASGVLEKLVADLGVPINKLNTTDNSKGQTDDNKGTDISAKGEAKAEIPKGDQQKKTPDAAPDQAKPVDQTPQSGQPPSTGQQEFTPPLGGSSGPLDAF